MSPVAVSSKKQGSVIFVVGGVIFALILLFGGFIKFTSNRRYSSGKLRKNYQARELAYSIATLATHQIKEIEIKNKDSNLYRQLSLPLNSMANETLEELQFTGKVKTAYDKLLNLNKALKNLVCEVGWKIKKESFSPLLTAYPREKTGEVQVLIDLTFQIPGSKETVTQYYTYSISLKVTANLIPILSRYSFYVKDALDGDSPERFNLVQTDVYGNLKNSKFKPWVIDNGNTNTTSFPSKFSEIMESPVGLIYLGGGPVILGNCRGWNNYGKYSEGFHLMAEGRGDGLYTAEWINSMAILNWETGLCDDFTDGPARFWYELIKDGFDQMSRKNSIFRLYGTDQNRSPTIVFGNVKTRTLCAKAFKEGNNFYGPLPYVRTQTRYDDICSGGSEDFDIGYFKTQVGNISRGSYNQKYASCLMEVPYNRGLSYIITNHQNPKPMDSGIISQSDSLYDFIKGNAVTNGFSEKVPEPYSQIFNDVLKLSQMETIFEKLQIPGERTLKTIKLNNGESIISKLVSEGFLHGNKLNLNGWILIESDSVEKIKINKNLQLESHGGLVFSKGDIEISAPISSGSEDNILHLVTRDGNIIFTSTANGDFCVSLVALSQNPDKGSLIVKGTVNSNTPRIHGNIILNRFVKNNMENNAARGIDLKYQKELFALPLRTTDEGSEKELLMFGFSPLPELVQ